MGKVFPLRPQWVNFAHTAKNVTLPLIGATGVTGRFLKKAPQRLLIAKAPAYPSKTVFCVDRFYHILNAGKKLDLMEEIVYSNL